MPRNHTCYWQDGRCCYIGCSGSMQHLSKTDTVEIFDDKVQENKIDRLYAITAVQPNVGGRGGQCICGSLDGGGALQPCDAHLVNRHRSPAARAHSLGCPARRIACRHCVRRAKGKRLAWASGQDPCWQRPILIHSGHSQCNVLLTILCGTISNELSMSCLCAANMIISI